MITLDTKTIFFFIWCATVFHLRYSRSVQVWCITWPVHQMASECSQYPVSLSFYCCPSAVYLSSHLLSLSPDTPLPDLDFPPVVSAAPSPSSVVPFYFGAYRFSWWCHCRCLSLLCPCSQCPCPCSQVQVSQNLKGADTVVEQSPVTFSHVSSVT